MNLRASAANTTPELRFNDSRQTRRLVRFALVLVIAVLLIGLIYYPLLLPLLASLFFAYLLAPVVGWLERRGIGRTLATASLIVVALLLFVFINANLLPFVYEEGLQLLHLVPQAARSLTLDTLPATRAFLVRLGLFSAQTFDQAMADWHPAAQFSQQASEALRSLWSSTPVFIGLVINIVLVPVLTFFMLRDYEDLRLGLRKLVPRDLVDPVDAFMHTVDWTLHTVIKAQLTVAAVLGAFYTCGFSLIHLNYAIVIGLVAGACRIVPYLDVIVGLLLSVIVVVTGGAGWAKLLEAAVVILVVQMLDGMIITPKIIGRRVGLHPGLAIVSVLAFGYWLGFYGILIAIPIVAIVQAVFKAALAAYMASSLYNPTADQPRDEKAGASVIK